MNDVEETGVGQHRREELKVDGKSRRKRRQRAWKVNHVFDKDIQHNWLLYVENKKSKQWIYHSQNFFTKDKKIKQLLRLLTPIIK